MSKKILVADDSRTICHIISGLLESLGYEVYTACDGLEAIIKAFFHEPDLIILDVIMPFVNGHHVCRALKIQPESRSVPIIMLTGKTDRADEYKGLSAGVDVYVTKPFENEELIYHVNKLFPQNSKPWNYDCTPGPVSSLIKRIEKKLERERSKLSNTEYDILRKSEYSIEILAFINRILDTKLFELSLINEISSLISSLNEYNDIVRLMLEKLSSFVKFTVAGIFLVPGEKAQRHCDISFLVKEEIEETYLEILRNRLMDEWKNYSLEPIEKQRIHTRVFFSKNSSLNSMDIKDTIPHSFMSVPLTARGSIFGILMISSQIQSAFTGEHFTVLSIFAGQSSAIIDNAILYDTIKSLSEEKDKRLNSLYEVSHQMNETFDMVSLMNLLADTIKRTVRVDKCSVIIRDPETNEITMKTGRGIDEGILQRIQGKISENTVMGWVVKNKTPMMITGEDGNGEGEEGIQRRGTYKTGSFISAPIISKNDVVGIINVSDKEDGTSMNHDDLELLTNMSLQLGNAIENATLYDELAEKQRLEKELEIARNIQMSWFPNKILEIGNYFVEGFCLPAREMAGDYYDYYSYPEEGKKSYFVLGDVTGKGVPAALSVLTFRSALRVKTDDQKDCGEILEFMNNVMVRESEPDVFITVFLASYDPVKNVFRYSNGGHEYPLIYRKKTGKIESLVSTGLLLGMFENVLYQEGEFSLDEGDLLFVYTDGLLDCQNRQGEQYGKGRILELVKKISDLAPEKIGDACKNEILQYRQGEKQFDDITVLVIRKQYN